ncbi:MAG: hypothetical protein ACOH2N_07380 [Devosia sp.]
MRIFAKVVLVLIALIVLAGPVWADKVVDCSAVSDRATAAAKTGINIVLTTSGKTCTFSMDGAATSKSMMPDDMARQPDPYARDEAFGRLARALFEQYPDYVSEQDLAELIIVPILGIGATDTIEFQNFSLLESKGPVSECLRQGISDGTTFQQMGGFRTFACGSINLNQSDKPIDVTLPGTDGYVEVSGTGIVYVLAFVFNDIAFYFFADYSSLQNVMSM